MLWGGGMSTADLTETCISGFRMKISEVVSLLEVYHKHSLQFIKTE